MSIAAIDFGRKRVGLALTDTREEIAYPLATLVRGAMVSDIKAIAARLDGCEVRLLVLGLPLSMDGSEGPSARAARAFGERLGKSMALPVEFFDERLTSVEAEERLRGAPGSIKRRRAALDAVAATIILEGWMDANRSRLGPSA